MKLTQDELALIENALLTYEGPFDEAVLDNLVRKLRYLLSE